MATLYRYIRFNVNGRRGGGSGYVSMSQIEMLDTNGNSYTYPSGTTISQTANTFAVEGNKEKLIYQPHNGNIRYIFYYPGSTVSFTIDLQSAVLDATIYTKWCWYLSAEQAYSDRDPLNFSLELSEDGTNWIEVDSVVNVPLVPLSSRPAVGYTGNIVMPSPPPVTGFRYIRLDILKKRASDSYIQLSDVRFKTSAGVFFTWPSSTICTSTTSPTGSGENASKLIDGNTSTKFCTFANTTSITFDMGSNKYVDISEYTQWCWYTANDGPNRDPVSFTLYGSQDGTNWVELDSAVDASITTTRKALAYTGNLSVPVPSYTVRFNSNMPPDNLWNGEIYDGYYNYSGGGLGIGKVAGCKYAMVEVIPGKTYALTIYADSSKVKRSGVKMLGSNHTMPLSNTNNAIRSIDGTDNPTFPRTYTITVNSNECYIMIYGSNEKLQDTSWTVECYDVTSNTPYTQAIEVDVPTALTPNRFIRENKNMIGWSTSPTGGVDYDDEEVVTNLGSEGDIVDLYAVWELSKGYLLGDGNDYIYTIINNTISKVTGVTEASLSATTFKANGFLELPSSSILVSLTNPKIYLWDSRRLRNFNAKVSAIPYPQIISKALDFSHETIVGFDSITATYSGNVNVQYSYDNSTWTTPDTMTNFLNIDVDTLYSGLLSSKILYIRVILEDENASFTKLIISCKNPED